MDIRLDPLSLEHLPHVMKWVNDPDVTRYFANRQKEISVEDEKHYIEMLLTSPNDRAYSLFTNKGRSYVGQCSINQIYWPARLGRLFMVIVPQYQGRGFGKAALRRLLGLARDDLNLHKVWAMVREENMRSRALLRSCGFQFEGLLQDEYSLDGGKTYLDMIRMAAFP